MPELIINSERTRVEAIGSLTVLNLDHVWELKITKKRAKRTLQQNRALHLFFKHIALNLNAMGITFNYSGLKGSEMEMPYTEYLVKETIWKPIQMTLFEIESTRDLETFHINSILDVLTNFFAKHKVNITFPSQIDLIAKRFEDEGYY